MADYLEVEGPDGKVVEFPKGTDRATMAAAMKSHYDAQKQDRGSFLDPLMAGLMFNAQDEIRAGVRAGARKLFGNSGENLGQLYDEELQQSRDNLKGFQQRHPVLSPILETAGAVGGLMAAPEAALPMKAATTAGRLGRAAVEGAGLGAVSGFNSGEGGVENRLKGAAEGAALGGVAGTVGQGIANKLAKGALVKAAPTTDELRTSADQAYKAAEQSGAVLSNQAMRRMVTDITIKAKKEGIDPQIHPAASAAIRRLMNARDNEPATIENIDTLRKVIGGAAGSANPDERRIASIMRDKLDDFVSNLRPQDVIGGDPQGFAALEQARKTWSRMRKGEIIQQAIDLATPVAGNYSQSGYDNALRQQFKALSMKMIRDRRLRNTFTPAERAAINKVSNGGPMQGLLRLVGKMAPRGVVSSGHDILAGGAVGYYTGSPVIGAAATLGAMGAGVAGQAASTAMRKANANFAGALVRSGGTLPTAAMTPSQKAAFAISSGLGATQQPSLPQGPNPLLDAVLPSFNSAVGTR